MVGYTSKQDGNYMNKQLIVERDVMVPMRDDINLATDIYRPDDLSLIHI